MQLSFDARIPDGLLAANALLNEKPHQGVPSWNLALHQGIDERNSTAAIGIRASAQLNRIWPRYTGKERDAESGLDYFGARYYASNMGRFMSPDWASKPTPVPYANLTMPQTLNLYSYGGNNPLTGVDPNGHCDWCQKIWNLVVVHKLQTDAQLHPPTVTTTQNEGTALPAAAAAAIARISPAAARAAYKAANPGQEIPWDAVRGRFYDMAHIKALADGGDNAGGNFKPQEHGEHMQEHIDQGDFSRWAQRAGKSIEDVAESAYEEVKPDLQHSAQEVEDAVNEVQANPVQALQEGAAAVAEAVESGEVPP